MLNSVIGKAFAARPETPRTETAPNRRQIGPGEVAPSGFLGAFSVYGLAEHVCRIPLIRLSRIGVGVESPLSQLFMARVRFNNTGQGTHKEGALIGKLCFR
jgi:hypothetical protein